jgi:hypothetical protein
VSKGTHTHHGGTVDYCSLLIYHPQEDRSDQNTVLTMHMYLMYTVFMRMKSANPLSSSHAVGSSSEAEDPLLSAIGGLRNFMVVIDLYYRIKTSTKESCENNKKAT